MLVLWMAAALAAPLPDGVMRQIEQADSVALHNVSQWQPVPTRAGTLRFLGSPIDDASLLDALMLQRLNAGNDSVGVQVAIVDYLSESESLDAFWRTFWDERPSLRVAMLAHAKDADAGHATDMLLLGMMDADSAVRTEAVRLSGYRGEAALSTALSLRLQDEDATVRALAARAIGWRQDRQHFEALQPLLSDEAADVRLNALRAMHALDAEATQGIAALTALQQDADPRVVNLVNRIAED